MSPPSSRLPFRRQRSTSGATSLSAKRAASADGSFGAGGARTASPTGPAGSGSGGSGSGSGGSRGGQGRPTPTRKEAEAAAKARARAALDPKLSAKARRSERAERTRMIREGMRSGDDRYLSARDKGPVRRFVRDYVDVRVTMAELSLPLLVSSLLFSSVGFERAGGLLINVTLLLVVLDGVWLRFRLRRELKRRFPEADLKGTTFYALMRALQLRFLRLPKPQVKLGQPLPERYR